MIKGTQMTNRSATSQGKVKMPLPLVLGFERTGHERQRGGLEAGEGRSSSQEPEASAPGKRHGDEPVRF